MDGKTAKKIEAVGKALLLIAAAALMAIVWPPLLPDVGANTAARANTHTAQPPAYGTPLERGAGAQSATGRTETESPLPPFEKGAYTTVWPEGVDLHSLSPESLSTYDRATMAKMNAQTDEKAVVVGVLAETADGGKAEKPKTRYYDVPLDDGVQDRIMALCGEIGLDPRVVFAIIRHESRFTPDVVSKTGDYGLMQINRCNHGWLSRELGTTDFLDPVQNVEAGIHILSLLLPKYDTLHKVLMCYAAGENGAKRKWFSKGIYETKFSRTVIADMENYVLR